MCFVVTPTGKRSIENKWLHDVNKDNHNLHYKQVIQEMLTLQDGQPWKRDSTAHVTKTRTATTRMIFPVY